MVPLVSRYQTIKKSLEDFTKVKISKICMLGPLSKSLASEGNFFSELIDFWNLHIFHRFAATNPLMVGLKLTLSLTFGEKTSTISKWLVRTQHSTVASSKTYYKDIFGIGNVDQQNAKVTVAKEHLQIRNILLKTHQWAWSVDPSILGCTDRKYYQYMLGIKIK